jgi:membrane-bound lytic murein transglycosylase A
MKKGLLWLVGLAIVATLAGCSTGTRQPEVSTAAPGVSTPSRDLGPLTGSLAHPKSRWVPVEWSDLPGFNDDALHEG